MSLHADGTPASCHGGSAPVRLAADGTPLHGGRVDMNRARKQWSR